VYEDDVLLLEQAPGPPKITLCRHVAGAVVDRTFLGESSQTIAGAKINRGNLRAVPSIYEVCQPDRKINIDFSSTIKLFSR
jgi:hypothetical protein